MECYCELEEYNFNSAKEDYINKLYEIVYGTKEEINQSLNNKQNVITDLDTIRAGASKGATALQSIPDEYITEAELESKGYLTEHQDISNLATKEELTNGLSDKQDNLVDGINIKTINGTSILGEGDIKIEDTVYTAGTDIQIDNNIISVCEPVEYGLGEWNSIKNNTNFSSLGGFVNLIYGNNNLSACVSRNLL